MGGGLGVVKFDGWAKDCPCDSQRKINCCRPRPTHPPTVERVVHVPKYDGGGRVALPLQGRERRPQVVVPVVPLLLPVFLGGRQGWAWV
jgi:hypothetical protein